MTHPKYSEWARKRACDIVDEISGLMTIRSSDWELLRKLISIALLRVRAEVIEECAEVANKFLEGRDYNGFGHEQFLYACIVAEEIRALVPRD